MEVFVIRLWPRDPAVRGKLEHAASGTSQVFESGQELLRLLTDQVDADNATVAPAPGALTLPELEAPPA